MLRAVVLAAMCMAASLPRAHDYAELAPLPPELRGVLIEALEAASESGRLSAAGGDGPDRQPDEVLAAAISSLDAADRAWLAERVRQRAGIGDTGALPDNLLLPLFHELSDFMRLYRQHGHGAAGDPAAAEDYARLRAVAGALGGAP